VQAGREVRSNLAAPARWLFGSCSYILVLFVQADGGRLPCLAGASGRRACGPGRRKGARG
jgi:hypothetical protein